MGNAMFYHLTRSPAERLLTQLIGKAQEAGWRIEVRGSDAARMALLDEQLWQGDGFLPHGLAGGAHDARQPVLLTVAGDAGAPPANAPACLMTLDGAGVAPEDCARMQRTCILFDGGSDAQVAQARDQWRALTAVGTQAEYWAEEDGRWQRKR
ncbi:DNA polymerase III subunit chi [Paracoccus sp. TK19116]|uniref:DNA polymerase III subunit chi n=1 Tax=Paracoccus albicereus TaxID=2922394 RepID=A0ABT1MQD2_9RHOB|nr:DNA polymerase III subunit chi [Paracoccus albicereus]MCQ0970522.1 DNA polymerase III subunit chi [Paracoccus albicereus]